MDEFLEELTFSDSRLEFFEGRIVAFAGGSVAHGTLCARLIARFSEAGRAGCRVLTSDVAVRIGDDAYCFPDLAYTCEPVSPTATATTAPTVLVEVVSPQSTRRDRVEKLRAYLRIPTLRAYLILDSLRASATLYVRDGERFVTAGDLGPGAVVILDDPALVLSLDDLYRDVLT